MLPSDVLTRIFSYVPDQSLGDCFLTCREWVRLRPRPEVWHSRSVWGGWKETRRRRISKMSILNENSTYTCKSLVGHKHMITCVEIAPREPSLICTASMSEVILWRDDEKVIEARLPSQGRGSPSVRISDDSSSMMFPRVSSHGGLRNTLVFCDISKGGQEVVVLPKRSKGILSGCCDCQFSRSNSSVAAMCFEDGSIVVVDRRLPSKSSNTTHLQTKGRKWFSDLQLSSLAFPTDHTLVTGSYDRCVRAYDLRCSSMADKSNKTRGMVWCQEMKDSGVENVVAQDDFVYVGLCSSNQIMILDNTTGGEISSFNSTNFNTALAVNSDGVVFNSSDKHLGHRQFAHNGIKGATLPGRTLKPNNAKQSSSGSLTAHLSDRCFAMDAAISRDSSCVVAGYNSGMVCVWRPSVL